MTTIDDSTPVHLRGNGRPVREERAATMDPEPIAAVALPRIPSGFHGSWIAS